MAQIDAEAAADKAGFSDEDDVQFAVLEPDALPAYGEKTSPQKKKKGGQPKGKGRTRVQPMFFDPKSDLFKEEAVVKQAKDRFKVVCMDMCEWFRDAKNKQKYACEGGQIDGFLADAPYGNQRGNHAQDPDLSDQVVNEVSQGMYEFGSPKCTSVIGCGHMEQVCCHCRCCWLLLAL